MVKILQDLKCSSKLTLKRLRRVINQLVTEHGRINLQVMNYTVKISIIYIFIV